MHAWGGRSGWGRGEYLHGLSAGEFARLFERAESGREKAPSFLPSPVGSVGFPEETVPRLEEAHSFRIPLRLRLQCEIAGIRLSIVLSGWTLFVAPRRLLLVVGWKFGESGW